MRPARFEYLAPSSAEEAIEQLARFAGDGRLLAGGQSLIPLMNLRLARPVALIDLGRCAELTYIERSGDWLAIGPMTRQTEVENSALVKECCPLLAKAMRYVGHPTIRNRGTLGGTLAHADRVAELPGVALALGAIMTAQGPRGSRMIAAAEFFVGDLATALEFDEMLREVRFPVSPANSASAFVEASNRHHDLATVGVAASLEFGPARQCRAASLAVVGVAPTPLRLAAAESRLRAGLFDSVAIAEASALAVKEVSVEGDFHASASYRQRALGGLLERALHECRAQTEDIAG
ncbi:MAG: FAD binding domain-containing protein [Burkholderiales bacterium]